MPSKQRPERKRNGRWQPSIYFSIIRSARTMSNFSNIHRLVYSELEAHRISVELTALTLSSNLAITTNVVRRTLCTEVASQRDLFSRSNSGQASVVFDSCSKVLSRACNDTLSAILELYDALRTRFRSCVHAEFGKSAALDL